MNYYYPNNQQIFFAAMFFVGFFIGILYDLFKVKRQLMYCNGFLLFIDDVLFSVISVFIYLISVFIFNNGIVRWFSVLSCISGFVIYKNSISFLFTYIMTLFVAFVRKICSILLGILAYPFLIVFRFLITPSNWIFRNYTKYKIYHFLLCDRW